VVGGAAVVPGQAAGFPESPERLKTGDCKAPSSVGGDSGGHWCSGRLILQDFALGSPPAKQSIHSIPGILTQLFCPKEVSQKPSISMAS